MSKPSTAAKPARPAQPIIKIRFLQRTSCETVEGQHIEADKGAEWEVPKRAGEYLIALKKAEAI